MGYWTLLFLKNKIKIRQSLSDASYKGSVWLYKLFDKKELFGGV